MPDSRLLLILMLLVLERLELLLLNHQVHCAPSLSTLAVPGKLVH